MCNVLMLLLLLLQRPLQLKAADDAVEAAVSNSKAQKNTPQQNRGKTTATLIGAGCISATFPWNAKLSVGSPGYLFCVGAARLQLLRNSYSVKSEICKKCAIGNVLNEREWIPHNVLGRTLPFALKKRARPQRAPRLMKGNGYPIMY